MVYDGYTMNYRDNNFPAQTAQKKQATELPPVLYRCGNDWYIAGVKSEFKDGERPPFLPLPASFRDRHHFTPVRDGKPQQVYYHKITPKLARMLFVPKRTTNVYSDRMCDELDKAGGGWLAQLPAGAQPVTSTYLSDANFNRPKNWQYVEKDRRSHAPWYAWPAAGLTFVCVDLPLSVVGSAAFIVLSPVLIPTGAYVMNKKALEYGGGSTPVILHGANGEDRILTDEEIRQRAPKEFR